MSKCWCGSMLMISRRDYLYKHAFFTSRHRPNKRSTISAHPHHSRARLLFSASVHGSLSWKRKEIPGRGCPAIVTSVQTNPPPYVNALQPSRASKSRAQVPTVLQNSLCTSLLSFDCNYTSLLSACTTASKPPPCLSKQQQPSPTLAASFSSSPTR